MYASNRILRNVRLDPGKLGGCGSKSAYARGGLGCRNRSERTPMNPPGPFLVPIAIGALLIANLGVSIAIGRSGYFASNQKVAQIVVVWLLPLIGAVLVGVFLYSQRDNPRFDTRTFPETSEKAIAATVSESLQGHDHSP